jgi:hypothetical protein
MRVSSIPSFPHPQLSADIFIAAASGMARAGRTAWLYPAEMVGTVLMFVGFLQAGTLRRETPHTAATEK